MRASDLRAIGALRPGTAFGWITMQTATGDRRKVAVHSDIGPFGDGELRISISSAGLIGQNRHDLWKGAVQVVSRGLSWTSSPVSWMVCPQTQSPCRTLYLPPGGSQLACYRYWPRDKYAHASENRSRVRRSIDRSRKLRSKLARDSDWLAPIPPKPKHQSSDRYAELVGGILAAEQREASAISELLDKLHRARRG